MTTPLLYFGSRPGMWFEMPSLSVYRSSPFILTFRRISVTHLTDLSVAHPTRTPPFTLVQLTLSKGSQSIFRLYHPHPSLYFGGEIYHLVIGHRLVTAPIVADPVPSSLVQRTTVDVVAGETLHRSAEAV